MVRTPLQKEKTEKRDVILVKSLKQVENDDGSDKDLFNPDMYEKEERKKLVKQVKKKKVKESAEESSNNDSDSSFKEPKKRKERIKSSSKSSNCKPVKQYKLRSVEREKRAISESVNDKGELVISLAYSESSDEVSVPIQKPAKKARYSKEKEKHNDPRVVAEEKARNKISE
jgi:hypothetical protein